MRRSFKIFKMKDHSKGNISLHLAHRFILRLERAGLTLRLIKDVCACSDNRLAEKMVSAVKEHDIKLILKEDIQGLKRIKEGKSFKKIAEFPIKIDCPPSINEFRKKYEQDFCQFDKQLRDVNFNPSTDFTVGNEMLAVVYRLLFSPSSDDCLKFIRAHGGQFPNLQGLALAYEQWGQSFPENLCFIGLDERNNLWTDLFGHKVVAVLWPKVKGASCFRITNLKKEWGRQDCILFFLPLKF